MSKTKARLVTVIIFTFIVLVCADLVAIYPRTLPWILGTFAVPGAWKFCRVCFIWLTVREEEPPLTYEDYAQVPKEGERQ